MPLSTQFCENGSYLTEPWTDHGLSHCFLETVASTVIFGFILIFGGIQIVIYRKFSTPVEKRLQPHSCLYIFQILLSVIMAMQTVLRCVLESSVIGDKMIYGYQLMSTCFLILIWPISIVVMCLERKRLLPSIPTRGHGLVLLMFWTLVFVHQNLAFVSWFSADWWWINRE